MKPYVLSLLVFLVALPTLAQQRADYAFDQRSVLVGGSAGYDHTTITSEGGAEVEITQLNVNPQALVFVREHLAVGGAFLANVVWQDGVTVGGGFGPAVAYFFGGPDRNLYPFLRAEVLYGYQDQEGRRTGTTTTQARLSVGGALMMAQNVAFTTELYLQRRNERFTNFDQRITSRINSYGLRFGIAAFVF